MDNKINGKTPDEIKKGLECLVRAKYPNAYCGDCSYHANAAQYLHECKSPEIITDTIAYIQQLERERDAAVEDIPHVCTKCTYCEHRFLADGSLTDRCGTCVYNGMCNWQWRGAQEEA